MFGKGKARHAGVSIEISLTVVLASAVLILIIGLFSEHLKTLADSTNLGNMFNKNSAAKTAQTYMANDPTVVQVNVQMVGDQGVSIDTYNQQAINTIKNLLANEPLSEQQILDLAEAITIYSVSGTKEPDTMLNDKLTIGGTTKTYNDWAKDYNIYVNPGSYNTIVGDDIVANWSASDNNYTGSDPNADSKLRVDNVETIKKEFS